MTLIRIDPAAPYMLQEVARAINGQAGQDAEPRPALAGHQRRPRRPRRARRSPDDGAATRSSGRSSIPTSGGGAGTSTRSARRPTTATRRRSRAGRRATSPYCAACSGLEGHPRRRLDAGLDGGLSGRRLQRPEPVLRRPHVPTRPVVPGGGRHQRPGVDRPVPRRGRQRLHGVRRAGNPPPGRGVDAGTELPRLADSGVRPGERRRCPRTPGFASPSSGASRTTRCRCASAKTPTASR